MDVMYEIEIYSLVMRVMGWGPGPADELPHKKTGTRPLDNTPIPSRVKIAIIL
jgi:hypothetical protein